MRIEWFYYFLETAKSKSLNKASEKLNMTQPALSKLIRSLENELEITLFHRTVTGLELTTAGLQLQARIVPILEELQVLYSDLRSLDGFKKLKIGLLPSIATYYIPGLMSKLSETFPDIQLVVENTSEEVLNHLLAGDVQLVIACPKSPPRHFWQSPLFKEPYFCIVPPSSHLFEHESVYVADIAQEPLVVYPSNCDIRNTIVRNYYEFKVIPKISLEVPFSESILAFVTAGKGITIAPKMIADQAPRYGLRALKIDDFEEMRQVSIIARSDALGELFLNKLVR